MAFEAGYRHSVGNGTDTVATLVVPRATACDLADGSVTVQAFVVAGGQKNGAEITSTCEDGSAHYSGSYYIGGSGPNRLNGRIRGGDWITVTIGDSRYQTDVGVSSVRGWGEGGAMRALDFEGGLLTVSATGDLSAAETAGGLSAQSFKYLRLNGHRFGRSDPEAFHDGCSSVSELQHRQAFDTSFIC